MHQTVRPTILVTRPLPQANALAALIRQQGWQPIVFPTIVIESLLTNDNQSNAYLAQKHFDIAIFTSVNAVSGAKLLQPHQRAMIKCLAIGAATAAQLQQLGFEVANLPQQQYSSEGLLDLPELRALAGQSVVLFTGKEGRTMLTETLQNRQATVTTVYCYQRVCPKPADRNIWRAWQEQGMNIILATSQENLRNLFALVDVSGHHFLQQCRLVTLSQRISHFAKSCGFMGEIRITRQASDQAIIECIKSWED